jgi:hypothetical protein
VSQSDSVSKGNVGRYSVLLGTLVLMLVALPFLDLTPAPARFRLLLSLVLLAGIGAASRRTWTLVAGLVLLVGFLVPTWLGPSLGGSPTLTALGRASGGLLLCLTIGVIVAALASARRVTTDTILGGVCAYLLLGVAFSVAMLVTEQLAPGSFSLAAATGSEMEPSTRLVYLSFVTLTTLGYGDMLPVSDVARMLCASEAVVGQLYVAIFVARLVALQLSQRGTE